MNILLHLKKSQLSLNDALVLAHILLHPNCRQRDILSATELNPTIISQVVKKFVQRGLVNEKREQADGTRNWAKSYSATREGTKLAALFCFPDVFSDTKAFSKKFAMPINKPEIYDNPDERDSLLSHLQEELDELHLAFKEGNRENQFDALIDLVYLSVRYCVALGFQFNEGWRRVQAANMAKVKVPSAKESKRGTSYDLMKPAGWTPPVLVDLV